MKRPVHGWLEETFESFLFNSRMIVIVAVLGSLVSAVLMFIHGIKQIASAAIGFLQHPLALGSHGPEDMSVALIGSIDSFLFATVLIIFSMGIYELFISRIDPASRTSESRPNWLAIHSLDDLKGAVGKVILMILIVRLFEAAVALRYQSPLDLLFLSVAILLVAIALYLQHAGHRTHGKSGEESPRFSERPSLRPPSSLDSK